MSVAVGYSDNSFYYSKQKTYEPNFRGGKMSGSALFMLIFIGGIVWGGFILAMIVGIKNEKSKKADK